MTTAMRAVISAESMGELRQVCSDSFDQLGFSDFTVGGYDIASGAALPCASLTTLSADVRAQYVEEVVHVDPVMARAIRGEAIVDWDGRSLAGRPAPARFREFLQDNGLRSGLNLSLQVKGREIWGMVLSSRVDRSVSPEIGQKAFSLSATVLLKRSLLLAAEAVMPSGEDPRLAQLSANQRDILGWIAQGKSNADIALILGLTKRAVDYHVTQILRKLGVASRTQAAALLAT